MYFSNDRFSQCRTFIASKFGPRIATVYAVLY